MKRALLWFGVLLLIGVLAAIVIFPGRPSEANQVLLFFVGLAELIWLCVGVAWGARGVVRYLRK